MFFLLKTIVSAIIIALVSEISKKFPAFGAIIISLPISTILAMIWLYIDTQDSTKIMELSNCMIWIVLPSIVFFIVLSFLLMRNLAFILAMFISSLAMIASYAIYIKLIKIMGINY